MAQLEIYNVWERWWGYPTFASLASLISQQKRNDHKKLYYNELNSSMLLVLGPILAFHSIFISVNIFRNSSSYFALNLCFFTAASSSLLFYNNQFQFRFVVFIFFHLYVFLIFLVHCVRYICICMYISTYIYICTYNIYLQLIANF